MSKSSILRVVCLSAMVLGLVVAATASAQQVYAPPVVGVHVYGYAAYPYILTAIMVPAGRCGRPCDTVTCRRRRSVVVVRGPSDFLASPYYRFPYYGLSVLRLPVLRLAETAGRLRKRDRSERFDVPARLRAAEPGGVPCGVRLRPRRFRRRPTRRRRRRRRPRQLPAPTPAPETIPTPPSELGPREF